MSDEKSSPSPMEELEIRAAVEKFQRIQENEDIQDCVKKGFERYEEDHPCEKCVSRVQLPTTPKKLQRHIKQCREKVKRDKGTRRLPAESDCLCLLVLRLAVVEEYTNLEIANMLGKTEVAVRRLLSDCRNKIRPRLEACRELVL
jgi:predicted transcriptional regulator